MKPHAVELYLTPQAKDLGGFEVRRVLPSVNRKLVGPFVFFDHLGPAEFKNGQAIDVRPHPHIGLATVTYLFEGELLHRDSLHNVQRILPGDVNWMTAGKGIVHSERTPDELRGSTFSMHGIQSWVALPKSAEEGEPGFFHHPKSTLPVIAQPGVTMRLIAGRAYEAESPVVTASPMFYLDVELAPGSQLQVPNDFHDRAVYLVRGDLDLNGSATEGVPSMLILAPGVDVMLTAKAPTRLMLLGGEPLDGDRYIWWNFVASSRDKIDQAKQKWRQGEIGEIPGESEFIPLPSD